MFYAALCLITLNKTDNLYCNTHVFKMNKPGFRSKKRSPTNRIDQSPYSAMLPRYHEKANKVPEKPPKFKSAQNSMPLSW